MTETRNDNLNERLAAITELVAIDPAAGSFVVMMAANQLAISPVAILHGANRRRDTTLWLFAGTDSQ
jgi:hypothetical protein